MNNNLPLSQEVSIRSLDPVLLSDLEKRYQFEGIDPRVARRLYYRCRFGNFVACNEESLCGHVCVSYFRPFYFNIALGKFEVRAPRQFFSLMSKLGLLSELEISSIRVFSQYQGKGIGTILLKKGISYAESLGAKELFLLVREENVKAVSLYEKNGFVPVGLFNGKIKMRKIL